MKYLNIYWKNYKIGYLLYINKKYIFIYNIKEINKTKKLGFNELIGFPDINQIYISKTLFPVFSSRIKYNERLKKENLNKSDSITSLLENEGKLITDNIKITKGTYEKKLQKHITL